MVGWVQYGHRASRDETPGGSFCLSPSLDWEGLFAYRGGMDNNEYLTGIDGHVYQPGVCPRGHKIRGKNALKRSAKARAPECRICRNIRSANYRRRQAGKPELDYATGKPVVEATPAPPEPQVRKYNPYMIEDLEILLGTCTTEELCDRLEYSNLTSLKRAVTSAGRLDLLQRIELQRRMEET